MARQIRLPYQDAPPGALEDRVHVLETRLSLLTRALRILAHERAAGRESAAEESAWRALEALTSADPEGVRYDGGARGGPP